MAQEYLSYSDYAQEIADSVINGQHEQAFRQFKNALADHCNAAQRCSRFYLHEGDELVAAAVKELRRTNRNGK